MNSRNSSDNPRLIIIGDFLFDPRDGLLSGPTGAHHVCPRMTGLLTLLLESPCRVLRRQQLIDALWPDEADASAALTQCVGRLRNYFGDSARAAKYIETVPRRGYRLVAPVYGSKRNPDVYRPVQTAPENLGGRLHALVQEFRDRKVCRAMLIYAIVIWLVFQISEIVVPALNIPTWVNSLVVVMGLLGFPIAATLAWIFDLTPSGLVRESGGAHGNSGGPIRKRSDFVFDTVLVAAALVLCVLLILSSTDSLSLSFTEAKADFTTIPDWGERLFPNEETTPCIDLLSQAQ